MFIENWNHPLTSFFRQAGFPSPAKEDVFVMSSAEGIEQEEARMI
jgi:hypothetical protein